MADCIQNSCVYLYGRLAEWPANWIAMVEAICYHHLVCATDTTVSQLVSEREGDQECGFN